MHNGPQLLVRPRCCTACKCSREFCATGHSRRSLRYFCAPNTLPFNFVERIFVVWSTCGTKCKKSSAAKIFACTQVAAGSREHECRQSKRQEAAQLIKDHKDLLYSAQGIQAGMPKGNGVPLTHVRCMMVGRRVAGTIAHAAVPVSCIHGVFFGTGCPQVLVSTIPIAITSVSPYFCV